MQYPYFININTLEYNDNNIDNQLYYTIHKVDEDEIQFIDL